MKTEREFFEKLPEIHKIMNENGIYFMNHSGWYEARDFKDFEYEQYINGAWYSWQARVPEGYVVVPKEPTPEMIDVGMGGFCFPLDNGCFDNHDLIFAYRAMLEAVEK